MYRVSAVAAQLFDARKAIDPALDGRHDLIVACLLHDMGNIIKFNFDSMPAPDGQNDYWKKTQREFKERFGSDELSASEKIMDELGVLARTHSILEHTSFPHSDELLANGSVLQKIAGYADQRVSPGGIVSLAERLDYMHRRYAERGTVYGDVNDPKIRALNDAIFEVERQIFEGLAIRPEDRTDASVAPIVESLRTFEI